MSRVSWCGSGKPALRSPLWLDSKAGRKGQEAGSEAEVMFEARFNPSGLTQMEKCIDVIESRAPP